MITFNITAQIYKKTDKTKQTILMNETIDSMSKENAITHFYTSLDPDYEIVKIYSIENISN